MSQIGIAWGSVLFFWNIGLAPVAETQLVAEKGVCQL
jgi:hypothetical protein